MTAEEIYSKIAGHMLKGIMTHEQLTNYYDFLGLQGYKRCHEYHYMAEIYSYRGLCRYFINHHNKLIPDEEIEAPEVIPENWYNYTRQDVDANTKKNAVKNGLVAWVEWERESKQLYEEMYKELMDIGEVASACKVKCLVLDVDKELKKAERYLLNKSATNFDLDLIIEEQHDKHEKYKAKLQKDIKVKIC